eukprot:925884-Pelagomonas_calceolata.AAC.1
MTQISECCLGVCCSSSASCPLHVAHFIAQPVLTEATSSTVSIAFIVQHGAPRMEDCCFSSVASSLLERGKRMNVFIVPLPLIARAPCAGKHAWNARNMSYT